MIRSLCLSVLTGVVALGSVAVFPGDAHAWWRRRGVVVVQPIVPVAPAPAAYYYPAPTPSVAYYTAPAPIPVPTVTYYAGPPVAVPAAIYTAPPVFYTPTPAAVYTAPIVRVR